MDFKITELLGIQLKDAVLRMLKLMLLFRVKVNGSNQKIHIGQASTATLMLLANMRMLAAELLIKIPIIKELMLRFGITKDIKFTTGIIMILLFQRMVGHFLRIHTLSLELIN